MEVKLCSEEAIDESAKHLLALREKVNGRPPEFLMICSATGAAYCREDGVVVVPIGCLRD